MHLGKKLLACFLGVLLTVTLICAPVSAANASGDLTASVVLMQDGYYLTVMYTSGNNSIKAGIFEVLTADGKTVLLRSPVVTFSKKSGTYSFKLDQDIPQNAVLKMTEDKANKPASATGKFAAGFIMPEPDPDIELDMNVYDNGDYYRLYPIDWEIVSVKAINQSGQEIPLIENRSGQRPDNTVVFGYNKYVEGKGFLPEMTAIDVFKNNLWQELDLTVRDADGNTFEVTLVNDRYKGLDMNIYDSGEYYRLYPVDFEIVSVEAKDQDGNPVPLIENRNGKSPNGTVVFGYNKYVEGYGFYAEMTAIDVFKNNTWQELTLTVSDALLRSFTVTLINDRYDADGPKPDPDPVIDVNVYDSGDYYRLYPVGWDIVSVKAITQSGREIPLIDNRSGERPDDTVVFGYNKYVEGTGFLPEMTAIDVFKNNTWQEVTLTLSDAKLNSFVVVLVNDRYEDPGTDTPELIQGFGTGNIGNIRVVEFNITPGEASDGTVIGVAGAAAPAALPVAIRLRDGNFVAADGGEYRANEAVAYEAGLTYHIKVMMNLPAGTYDVWITEEFNSPVDFSKPGGKPVQLAKDYNMAGSLSDVGGVYIGAGDCVITDARLIQSDFVSGIIGPDSAYDIESDNTAHEMTYKFDVEFESDNIDFLLCLHDGSVTPLEGAWTWLRYIFHTDQGSGIFNAYSNTGYATVASPALSTMGGKLYHVRMAFYWHEETSKWRYDVWVAPENGEPIMIAENYIARATSNSVAPYNNLNKLIIASAPAKTGWITNGVMLYSEQLETAVADVNTAADANAMGAALRSSSLGLSLSLYNQLSQEDKDEIHETMLSMKISSPFTDDLAIQIALEALVREKVQPPAPPSNLNVSVNEKTNQALITWDLSPDGSAIKYYEVGRSTGSSFNPDNYTVISMAPGSTVSSASDSSMEPNTQYTYAVKAVSFSSHESEWSRPVTVWSADKPVMPFDTALVAAAFSSALTRYSLIASNNSSYFGVDQSIPGAPKYAMGEWGSAGKGSSEAFKYLVSVCQYDPGYLGPDGVTTVEDRILAHMRSLIAGGNEWGCSGTGLSAQGYSSAVLALAAVKLTLPATWAKLSPEEQAKVDLLMEATLIGAHYATADANYNLQGSGYNNGRIPVLFASNQHNATTGVDQTGNYDRGWNINHRVGILTAVAAYYYFGGTAPASDGSKFKTAGSEYCNTVLAEFDYDVFMARLMDAGFTNIHTIFSSAGKYDESQPVGPYNYPQIALQPHTRSSSLSAAGEYIYYGNSMDNVSAWLLEFITSSLGSGPIRPYGGDTTKPNLEASVSNYPPYNQSQSIFRPYGYPGFILDDKDYDTYGGSAALGLTAVDTILNFPNLGAPGMYMEFDTSDGSDAAAPDKDASGARSSVGYVSEGMPYLVDSFYMLQVFDSPDDEGNVAGIPAVEYADLLSQTVAGMDDFLYKNNVRYQGYHKGFYRRNERASGNNILWQTDTWKSIVDNPTEKIAAVNSAADVYSMREAVEDPYFGLVLFQYNGLSDTGKDAAANSLLALVQTKPNYFTFKSDIQTALAAAVAVEAVKDFNVLTTAEEMLNALTVDLSSRASKYTPNALGIFVYGFTDEPNTGESGAKKLMVCQYVLDNIGDGYADKRALRDTIIRGLAEALPAPIKAVNDADNSDDMLTALLSEELGLDLTAFNRLTDDYKIQAAERMISGKPSGGYSNKADIQNKLNEIAISLYQALLLEDVNTASTADEMLTALITPDFGLNLSVFNMLTDSIKIAVAQAVLDNRPGSGFTGKAAVQAAFDAAIYANSDFNTPVTVQLSAAVCLDGRSPDTNNGGNNWASFKTDPLITQSYTRAGYIKLDLSSYAGLTPEDLVSLNVKVNIINANFDAEADSGLNKVATMALYPCSDTTQTQNTATYNNVITKNAAEFGAGQASGWRPAPASSNTVSYSEPGFYEFDITEYVRDKLANGETVIAFILSHTHTLQSTHQFSPLGAGASTRPYAVMVTKANPLASVNNAADTAEMINALSALGLSGFDALIDADKETVAAFVLGARPVAGYADLAYVQAAVETAIAELSKVETVTFYASVGVGIDAGGSDPRLADNNTGGNNWANFRSDGPSGQAPNLSWPYNRLGYFVYDLTPYTALADELVSLKVLINISSVNAAREPGIRIGLLPYADTNIGQLEATYNNVVTNNRGAVGDTLLSPVSLNGVGYYEFDVTGYAKAELAKGNTKIAFLMAHETSVGNNDMFSPLGAADSVKPYAVLTKREVNPLASVNNANNPNAMIAALRALGLDLSVFNLYLDSGDQARVAQVLIDTRPAAGYTGVGDVQTALDNAISTLPPAVRNVSQYTEPFENSVDSLEVIITGINLNDQTVEINLDGIYTQATVLSATEARAYVDIPRNDSPTSVSHTLKVFLNGSDTGKSTVITVLGTVGDPQFELSQTGKHSFAKAITGYADGGVLTVTVKNTGVVPLSGIEVSSGSVNFNVTQPASVALAVGETATFTVMPVLGLKPGAGAAIDASENEFKGIVTVSCDGAQAKSFDVGFMVNNTYSSTFEDGPYVIPSEANEYAFAGTAYIRLVATGTGQVDGTDKAIVITGNTDAFDIAGAPAGYYSLKGPAYPEGTVPDSCEFTVTPKVGLAPGTYSISIQFNAYKSAGTTTTVTFTVTP